MVIGMPVAVSAVSTTAPLNAGFGPGATIEIDVSLTGGVTVTGVPSLALNNNATALYDPTKSSPTQLAFVYTVGATGSHQDVLPLDYLNGARDHAARRGSDRADPAERDRGPGAAGTASAGDGLSAART